MGEDKALLPFAGFDTLVEYQYNRLSTIFTNVYISCKDKSLFAFDANFIEDKKNSSIFAPTLGFISAFDTLNTDKIFAISVDTPFITQKEIEKIMRADTSDVDAVITQTNEGVHPLCGIYHKTLLPKFEQMLKENNHKLSSLVKNVKTTYVSFPNSQAFFNMNHPKDYQKALQLLTC